MQTLNKNYQRNISILKQNIERGMTFEHAKRVIDSMERQFINANLYNKEEKDFINAMRSVLLNKFSHVSVTTN